MQLIHSSSTCIPLKALARPWDSLHQTYFLRQIRRLCLTHIRSLSSSFRWRGTCFSAPPQSSPPLSAPPPPDFGPPTSPPFWRLVSLFPFSPFLRLSPSQSRTLPHPYQTSTLTVLGGLFSCSSSAPSSGCSSPPSPPASDFAPSPSDCGVSPSFLDSSALVPLLPFLLLAVNNKID